MRSTLNHSTKILSMALLFCLGLSSSTFAEEQSASKGVGPVTELKLESLSLEKATAGKALFNSKGCTACHKVTERYVGPNLGDVFKRRKPEWIANMVLNPLEMTQKDEVAKDLFGEYLVQMPFQNVTKEDVEKIIEYLRYYSEKGDISNGAEKATGTKPLEAKKAKKDKKG